MLIGITKSLSDKLGDANYYILRTLFGLPKSTSYDSVFLLINTRTLEEWRFFHVLTLLFTSFNGNGLSYFKDFFKLRTVNYNLSDLETQTLSLSKILLIASRPYINSFASIANHLWNTLPCNICHCALHMVVYSLLFLCNFHYFQ